MTDPDGTSRAGADTPARSALRGARAARGWSQTDAARALRELAGRRGGPEASAASLKTQLSRWENGHARPEPEYRSLLAELYGRTAGELGLAPVSEPDGWARLRAELAGAAAADGTVVQQWAVQLAAAHRIDDELGAAGAAGVTTALVEQLTRTLRHTLEPGRRAAVAGVLAGAALLAGRQRLDADDPDGAWRQLDVAGAAARESASPALTVAAAVGRAEVLCEIGMADRAVAVLDVPDRETGPAGSPPDAAARTRVAAARAVAHAAAGDAPATRRALEEAARSFPAIDAVRPGGPAVELADLHRWHGRALLELGDPAAAGPLRSALAAGPTSARARAEIHTGLSRALAGADDTAAAGHARQARALAERIGSRSTVARLDGHPPGRPR